MNSEEVIKKLKTLKNPKNVEGMARFGINPDKTLGVSVPYLRKTAKQAGRNHELALKLWKSGIHEARILASMVDEIKKVDEQQMDSWIKGFDSWDVCDQCCMNLFYQHPLAYKKAAQWATLKQEFEKRAGFALMACLAWKDKNADDKQYFPFFDLIKKYSTDERNFVKKAVNWALRQIGKKNLNLNKKAIKTAEEIQKINSKSSRWVANDALKELKGEAVQKKFSR